MKIYWYAHAPYARKVMLAAFERGTSFAEEVVVPPWDRVVLNAMRDLEGQPLATVPLLRLDDGTLIYESSLIVEYLDRIAEGGPVLVPADPKVSFEVRALDRFIDQHLIAPSVYLTWAHRLPVDQQNAKKIQSFREKFAMAMGRLDTLLAAPNGGPTDHGRRYLLADRFTLADAAASCGVADALTYWPQPCDMMPYPNVMRWFEDVQARASWRRLLDVAKTQVPPPDTLRG